MYICLAFLGIPARAASYLSLTYTPLCPILCLGAFWLLPPKASIPRV